jgi:hypothetical protein
MGMLTAALTPATAAFTLSAMVEATNHLAAAAETALLPPTPVETLVEAPGTVGPLRGTLLAPASAARLALIADANHVLKSVPADDRAANMATYANPSLPLAAGIVDAIADFVTASPASPRR